MWEQAREGVYVYMHARTRHANHVRLPDPADSTRRLSLTPTRTRRRASRSATTHRLRLRWTRRSLRLSTIHALLRLWLHLSDCTKLSDCIELQASCSTKPPSLHLTTRIQQLTDFSTRSSIKLSHGLIFFQIFFNHHISLDIIHMPPRIL